MYIFVCERLEIDDVLFNHYLSDSAFRKAIRLAIRKAISYTLIYIHMPEA